jgi:Membrane bound O-acyl transferase family
MFIGKLFGHERRARGFSRHVTRFKTKEKTVRNLASALNVGPGNVGPGNVVQGLDAASNGGRKQVWIAWVALVVLPLACTAFRSSFAPWVFMWLLAGAIFIGCKWQTWWEARVSFRPNWTRSAAYLLLWPGMDAQQFLDPVSTKRSVPLAEWLAALFKTLSGAALIVAAKSALLVGRPFLGAWIGMIGIVLILHFGAFYFIALAWQKVGVHAEPIMQRPLQSQSLGELWGKRWNLGFRDLSHKLVFRPLQRRYGVVAATLGVFLMSGLVHELVISVPARAGFGLPTVYFLAQGLAVVVERSTTGKRLGLAGGITGRIWTALVALGPVLILFHPWFVTRVMVPFLNAPFLNAL